MKTTMQKYGVMLLSAFVLFGCAAFINGFGTLVPDQIAEKNFETYQVNPGMNYYFSGAEAWPDAIIGVNKTYTLGASLWTKIGATPDVFKNLVSGMKSRPDSPSPRGYAILDDKGRQIGVWYSIFGVSGYVKMEGENTVDIATPINPTRPELRAP